MYTQTRHIGYTHKNTYNNNAHTNGQVLIEKIDEGIISKTDEFDLIMMDVEKTTQNEARWLIKIDLGHG